MRSANCKILDKTLPVAERFLIPHSAFRTSHSKKGFTLVELSVVIVVLGVIMSLIIPRLGEIGEANLRRSARHLTGMIRFLRDESQARKKTYLLRFDIKEGRYWAEEEFVTIDLETGHEAREWKQLQSEIGSEGSLSGATTFRDIQVPRHPDEPLIVFRPDGWVEPAYIHLRDGSDRDYTLRVKPLLGDTELIEGYVEER